MKQMIVVAEQKSSLGFFALTYFDGWRPSSSEASAGVVGDGPLSANVPSKHVKLKRPKLVLCNKKNLCSAFWRRNVFSL